MQIEQVQRLVMSALLGTVGFVFAGGLCLLASIADRPGGRPGLLAVAAAVGVVTVAGVRTINQRSILSPWLVVGLLPAAIGAWFLLLS
ncbi:transcriptional regulator [Nocardioides sp. JQ2195]|uniref:transcriptional regulator n=1 Tax=Nocardioides sp. JQ2195 TaxID=2592334 RepID=UPI00143E0F1F|nr:transcriptional regulator [Nocardioides sp. JQ2195]QIX26036.1 transcriptional regulator [Nocardioides sp. JQ2195]